MSQPYDKKIWKERLKSAVMMVGMDEDVIFGLLTLPVKMTEDGPEPVCVIYMEAGAVWAIRTEDGERIMLVPRKEPFTKM